MGMRVLLTGANGFVGRHLLPRLLGEGHDVITYDLNPPITQDHSCGHLDIITGDLSSGEGLDQIVWEDVNAVIHLAAAGVKASQRNWYDCVSVNLIGTEQLIHAMNHVFTPPLLIYPRTFYEKYLNEFPDLKSNPYVVTKAAGTRVVELWASGNENACVVFSTIFQVYGPGDDPNSVLTYAAGCLRNKVITQLGSGRGLRDWIYIEDLVDAFIRALSLSGNRIQNFDFGTGKLTSLKEMVEILAKLLGSSNDLLQFNPKRDRGDTELVSGAEKTLQDWEPNFSIEAGLTRFVNSLGKF